MKQIDEYELNEIYDRILVQYKTVLNDIFKVCQSPIEIVFLSGLLSELLDRSKDFIGFRHFTPVYDFEDYTNRLICIGISVCSHKFSVVNLANNKTIRKYELEMKIFPQYQVSVGSRNYFLDFAIIVVNNHNVKRKSIQIAVECDGKNFHSSKDRLEYDKLRELDLKRKGWSVIRFTGKEINKFTSIDYKIIFDTINEMIENYYGFSKDELASIEEIFGKKEIHQELPLGKIF